jgi:hypothetical protein
MEGCLTELPLRYRIYIDLNKPRRETIFLCGVLSEYILLPKILFLKFGDSDLRRIKSNSQLIIVELSQGV